MKKVIRVDSWKQEDINEKIREINKKETKDEPTFVVDEFKFRRTSGDIVNNKITFLILKQKFEVKEDGEM